jgi:hypothetical protein
MPVIRGHLPALDHDVMDPPRAPYMFRINDHLGRTGLSAFPALAPEHHAAHTVLTGLLDRSALYGAPAEIEALGLDLLEDPQAHPGPHIDVEGPVAEVPAHRHCDFPGRKPETPAPNGTLASDADESQASPMQPARATIDE